MPEFVYLLTVWHAQGEHDFHVLFQAWNLWSLAALTSSPACCISQNHRLIVCSSYIFRRRYWFRFSLAQQVKTTSGFGSHWLDYLVLSIPVLFLVWIGLTLVKKRYRVTLSVLCLVGLAAGLIYPTIELWNKTEGFRPRDGYSLDGKQDFYLYSPNEMAAAGCWQMLRWALCRSGSERAAA